MVSWLCQPSLGVSTAVEDCGRLMVLQSALGLKSTHSVLCGSVQLSEQTALLLVIPWQTILAWLHQQQPKLDTAPACCDEVNFLWSVIPAGHSVHFMHEGVQVCDDISSQFDIVTVCRLMLWHSAHIGVLTQPYCNSACRNILFQQRSHCFQTSHCCNRHPQSSSEVA